MSGGRSSRSVAWLLLLGATAAAWLSPGVAARPAAGGAATGWEPSRPVRLVVPAERGGEADATARALRDIVAREGLLAQPVEVVNRPGEGGAEGFDEVGAARGDPHVLVLGLSNLFTAPPTTGSIGWRDMTPVAMLALEPVALWVHAGSAHRGVPDLVSAAMAGEVRVGAAGGAGQAGAMVVSAMARATGAGFTLAPAAGGPGGAARALGERRVDAAVGGLADALAEWEAGRARPLCVFGRAARPGGGAAAAAEFWGWGGVPDCRDEGLAVEYVAHRGVLLPAAVAPEQRAFYEGLLLRVRESPAWREALDGALLESAAAAPDAAAYARWLAAEELRHEEWLYAGGVFARR